MREEGRRKMGRSGGIGNGEVERRRRRKKHKITGGGIENGKVEKGRKEERMRRSG